MRTSLRCLTAFALSAFTLNVAAETIGGLELIRRQQSAPTDAIVEYCRQSAPESIQVVEAGYAVYLSNLEKAMSIWISEKPDKQKFLQIQTASDSPQSRVVEAQIKEVAIRILKNVKQYDPQKYCPWVADRLKSSTPESILKSLHEYDARVEAKLKQKR